MHEVRAPLDETEGTRARLLRWLKAVGETVHANEPLIELETDKVTVEIPAPATGVLTRIAKHEQEQIEPGELLGCLEELEHAPAEAVSPRAHAAAEASRAERAVHPATQLPPHPAPQTATSVARRTGAGQPSPAVRRLLAERGLEPARVRGTGPGGRITVDDVLAHSASVDREPAATEVAEVPHGRLVPHSALRRRIAEHMVRSLESAPHVTTVFEADLGAVLAHRAQHAAQFEAQSAPLTLTAYFLAAAVAAIRAVPESNSRWREDALEIFEVINIGVATAVAGEGLMVPVLTGLERRSLASIARGLSDLVSRARAGRLEREDVRGGTFTISNHGVSGSLLAAPIVIHQPQAAILGVGRMQKRPVAAEAEDGSDRVVVRPMCYVTLTIDHRVMDGDAANRFLRAFVGRLESWPLT